MTTIRHVMIRGRVQGVGYRAWVAMTAASRRLDGWVRNRRDGTVEVLLTGDDAVVADMIAACHRGPPAARVDAVIVEEAGAELLAQRHAGERFSILPTVKFARAAALRPRGRSGRLLFSSASPRHARHSGPASPARA